MAVILEMRLNHPAHRCDPLQLRTPTIWDTRCPSCDAAFGGPTDLLMHILQYHPERFDAVNNK